MKTIIKLWIGIWILATASGQEIGQEIWAEKADSLIHSQESGAPRTVFETNIQGEDLTDTAGFSQTNYSQGLASNEIKIFSDHTILEKEISTDKIRIIGGDLVVWGTVKGRITVIGGNVEIKSTAVIDGEIITIGGDVTREPGATVNGKIIETNLKEGLVYRETSKEKGVTGKTDFALDERSEKSTTSWIHPKVSAFVYNRNEGLLFTPFDWRWDRRSLSNFRFSLSLGYRFGKQKDVAGRLTLEKSLFTNRNLTLYGSVFRESRTDDKFRIPLSENTIAAILGRQDFYDRWDETGYEFGLGIDISRLKIKVKAVSVEQLEIPVSDIWSLVDKKRLLRPNPAIDSSNINYLKGSLAFRSQVYHPLSSGYAFFLDAELYRSDIGLKELITLADNAIVHRYQGLAVLNWEFSQGLVLRTRFMVGFSRGDLDFHRLFNVGGLGSVSAYPYKIRRGDHFAQINAELILTPEFLDEDWVLKLFADGGNAWMKDTNGSASFTDKLKAGISSAGIGIGSHNNKDGLGIGVNIARPLDGTDVWETTVRLNYNF